MQARHENAKTQSDAPVAATPQSAASQARLAEVVQAAYVREARSR
jgi:hypothetical protein